MNVMTFVEIKDNKIRRASYEALSEGRRLADKTQSKLIAVMLGSNTKNFIKETVLNLADKINF